MSGPVAIEAAITNLCDTAQALAATTLSLTIIAGVFLVPLGVIAVVLGHRRRNAVVVVLGGAAAYYCTLAIVKLIALYLLTPWIVNMLIGAPARTYC